MKKDFTSPKKTAGNNELLRAVKLMMNAPVFIKTSAIMNTEGDAAALAYLQRFFNRPVDQAFFSNAVVNL